MYKKLMVIAAAFGLGFSGLAHAQSNYVLGTTLKPSQISELGTLKSFTVGMMTYRILPEGTGGGTYVINDQGKLGLCNGEVLISGVSTDQAKNALSAYQSSIVSTTVYDSLKMVSAKFSSLQEAANARNELATTLVGATVTLPITFNIPKVR